jgi:uncharacterized protein YcaQ
MSYKISIEDVKKLAIKSQLLNSRSNITLNVIEQLSYIQIDTISVIERAHNHTLWNRDRKFSSDALDKLLTKERKIYEYWGHAASYLPMKDFRFSLPKMNAYCKSDKTWVMQRRELAKDYYDLVYDRIKDEGPLGSSDFDHKKNSLKGDWWNFKPAKAALELLFWEGRLMVSSRKNFQKKFDLTERVLPDEINLTIPTDSEVAKHQILGAINSLGVVSLKTLTDFMFNKKQIILKELRNLIEAEIVVEVKVDKIEDKTFYTTDAKLDTTVKLGGRKKVFFLSPFDNLIIHRKRILELNNFDYSLECYVPEKKRKFGYFVLPILYGYNLVGRIDIKADRKSKTLILKSLYLEDGFKVSDSFASAYQDYLHDFMIFNGCETVKNNTNHSFSDYIKI